MENKKSLSVRFYSEPDREDIKEPVREWLCGLPEEERIEVGADIRIVQDYWPKVKDVKPKLIDHIKNGVWEIRTNLQDHWHRTFFGFLDDEILLLHAVKKKTNQTRKSDVDIALARLKKAKAANDKK
jgi:phage-related protein